MRSSRIAVAVTIVFLMTGGTLLAQEASPFHDDIVANIQGAGEKLISLAEAIPEDKYSWAPTDEVRSVSEVFMHFAGVNLLLPAALGAALPEGMEPPENPFAMMQEMEKTVTAKDDVIEKMHKSLEYVDGAVRSIQDLEAEVALFGPPQSKRAYILIILAHAHEHLGQSIAYARTLGVTPPWSQPAEDEGDDY